jgi:single-stranded-DNA-specific exonuclease
MISPQISVERGLRFRWELARRAPADMLAEMGDFNPLLCQLLLNRGLTDRDQARRFLAAEDEPLGDPLALADMSAALARVQIALDSGKPIAVYGDYDVDGVGLQDRTLADLRAAGVGLVVTVDCGVSAVDEIATATAAGLDVIVTDHHTVPMILPAAVVLNPNRPDCAYPFKDLAGVGVALKLAEALLRARLEPPEAEPAIDELLELVAIGTLADVVPLQGENRTMVRRGLARLNRSERPGLRALLALMRRGSAVIDAESVSFGLAPRLNAAGRLADARLALDVLLTDDAAEAEALAEQLDALNRRRQAQMAEALALARAELAATELGSAIVLAGPFAIGIVGPVAGRLAHEFNRPAIVLRRDGPVCSGSARSVAGLNVLAAMEQGAAFLDRFGGHPMAAGLSLQAANLADFERAFQVAIARAGRAEVPEPSLAVDAELRALTAASRSTLTLLNRLEPFGPGNPAPIFLTRGLRVAGCQEMGGGHLRLHLIGPDTHLTAIAFGQAEAAPTPGEQVDVVYRLRRKAWRGRISPELEVLDRRPSTSVPDGP